MKITVVSGPFLPMPPAPCGAVERIWSGLAEVFARRGHTVTVLCRHHPDQKKDEVVNGVHYLRKTQFVQQRRLSVNLMKDFLYAVFMARFLPPSDIVVTNTFWLPALLTLWRRTGAAARIAVHVARVPKGQLRLYSRVDRFQAVSQAIRDAIIAERPQLEPKVRVFPNPIDTKFFQPPPSPGRLRDSAPGPHSPGSPSPGSPSPDSPSPGSPGAGATRTLLYTGRIHPEKGLDLLIDSFKRVQPEFADLRLRLVGPWEVSRGGGGQGFLDSLRQRAAGAPVEFHEAIYDRARLAAVYQSADYYCYPSLAEQGEASPVAPVEAMATGLVPVVSDLAQFRDVIQHGETGWFFDHRGGDAVGALAQALRTLVADPALTARLGARAAQRAAELSNENVASLYLHDFDEMLGRART